MEEIVLRRLTYNRRKLSTIQLDGILFIQTGDTTNEKTLIDEMLDMEEFHAKHIAVVDSKSGRLLLGKKAYQMAYPASTTKIATCIYAIEQGELDQEVVMPRTTQTGSIAGISTGELVCMRDLLYGLMLISGNDIAEALAIHICGTIEKFMNELNKFINRIGLKIQYL